MRQTACPLWARNRHKLNFEQFGAGLPGAATDIIIVAPQLAEWPPRSHICNASQKLSD
jgi:hypothetical protein